MSKNTLFQEAESKRNADFLAPATLVYKSTLNRSQALDPKKRPESKSSLLLGLRQLRFFGDSKIKNSVMGLYLQPPWKWEEEEEESRISQAWCSPTEARAWRQQLDAASLGLCESQVIASTKIGIFFWETLEWPLSSRSEWKSLKARRLGISFQLKHQQSTRSTPFSSNKLYILGLSTPTHLTRTKKYLLLLYSKRCFQSSP